MVGGLVTFVVAGGQREEVSVDYQGLLAGSVPPTETRAEIGSGDFEIAEAGDPADEAFDFLRPDADRRLVSFVITVDNQRGGGPGDADVDIPVKESAFSLEDSDGDGHDPVLLVLDGEAGDGEIGHDDSGIDGAVLLVFAVPDTADPAELKWDVVDYIDEPRVGETIVWEFR